MVDLQEEQAEACEQLSEDLKDMLSASRDHSTAFVATLLGIAHQSLGTLFRTVGMSLPAALVADSAVRSFNYQTGVVLLEAQLVERQREKQERAGAPPPFKRSKSAIDTDKAVSPHFTAYTSHTWYHYAVLSFPLLLFSFVG